MKRSLFIFFVLIWFSNFAQSYYFDILSKYNCKSHESVLYINSKEDSYYLSVFRREDSLYGRLTDIKNFKIHNFKIKDTLINKELIFNFSYQNSEDFKFDYQEEYLKDYVFEFQTIDEKDSIKNVQLKIYKNAKKRRPIMVYDLVIKDYDKNIFPIVRINSLHPFERITKLNYTEKGIVIKAIGKTITGYDKIAELIEFKEVNFELLVKQ